MEKTQVKNYTVFVIGEGNVQVVALAAFPIPEPAIGLALEVHRVSNLPHKIQVVHPDKGIVVELVGKASIVPGDGESEK